MVFAQSRRADSPGFADGGFGVLVVPYALQQQRQVVQPDGDARIFATIERAAQRQGVLGEGCGTFIFPLAFQGSSQATHHRSHLRIRLAQHRSHHVQGFLVVSFRLDEASLQAP
jgi:hypothetical protein